jgi:lipopolysaccharide export system protein LptC
MTDNKRDDADTIWQPREAAVAHEVAQYSRFVSWMKIALPVAAGLLLLLVVVLPQFRGEEERFRIGADLLKDSGSDTLTMTNARYFGTDDKGQPFLVTAEGVRQQERADDAVRLVAPKAEINLTDGSYLSTAASYGLYDRKQQKLDLGGQVTVFQGDGNQLTTSAAIVQLKEGTASGREAVSGEGPLGTMQAAGGFDLTDRGRNVKFLGPAKLTINRGASPGAKQ